MQERAGLAVLLVAFRRPDTTRMVIDGLRRTRPPRLYFAVDGPRSDNEEETRLVAKVRELIDEIDWDCEVRTLFREENRGCARGVSEAISWFFEYEEAGAILEDDCVPNGAFFRYCEELLTRYRDDPRVAHISGSTRVPVEVPDASYFFSHYPQVWGWATWRQSWQRFRLQPEDFESALALVLKRFPTRRKKAYWEPLLRDTYSGRRDSWAYRWAFINWLDGSLSIYPGTNTVDNVGFDNRSTHTGRWSKDRWLQPPAADPGPLVHPSTRTRARELDELVFKRAYLKGTLPGRLARAARGLVDRVLERSHG